MGGFGGVSGFCRFQGQMGVLVGRPALRILSCWPATGAVMHGGGGTWVMPQGLGPRDKALVLGEEKLTSQTVVFKQSETVEIHIH